MLTMSGGSKSRKKVHKKPAINKLLCFAKEKLQDDDRDDNVLRELMGWKAMEDINFDGYPGLTQASMQQHQDLASVEGEIGRIYAVQSLLKRKCHHPSLGGIGTQNMTAIIIITATLDEKEPRIETFFA